MNIPFDWPCGPSDSFAFVLNPFHYTGNLPIEVMPGSRLGKANSQQVTMIQELREKLGRAGKSMAFDREPIPKELRESSQWDHKLWPRTTFWVINFNTVETDVLEFQRASQLTDNEIVIGALFPPKEQVYMPKVEYPWVMESFFDGGWYNDAQPLNVADLEKARRLVDAIRLFREEQKDDVAKELVLRVFDDFVGLSNDHRISHLRLLGHFGLIEALLTHNPAASSPRLSHQIRTKMPLLMRRFHRPIVLGQFFAINESPQIWALLYRLRSCYAHGEKPKFDKISQEGGFKELNNLQVVYHFVHESLKRLLILALNEPQLVFDLKRC